jgi:hypothetical protein
MRFSSFHRLFFFKLFYHIRVGSAHTIKYGPGRTSAGLIRRHEEDKGMSTFISKAILDFFIAFGIVLGGAMLGGMGAVVSLQPPTQTMLEVAGRIKIWALAAAVGGTIDPMRVIESNMLDGNLSPAIKQILYLIFAFLGAHMGTELVKWVCGNGRP